MKVFLSSKISENIEKLFEKNEIDFFIWPKSVPPTPQELLQHCRDMDGIISTLSDSINQDLIGQCPNLKVIANYAVGFNNIDIDFAKKQNIAVGNTPDVLSEATSDLALTLTLALSRRLLEANLYAKQGHWKGFEARGHLGLNLRSKTVGILGAGRIGQLYAKTMAKAFSTKTLYYSRTIKKEFEEDLNAKKVSLSEILERSDILSIHLPLNQGTKHLLQNKEFSLMKKSAILINTARGDIINQKDLLNILKNQGLFGAALDVTTPEPLDPHHELFQLKNCIITPHIGSATTDAREKMSEICFENILAGLKNLTLPYPV